MKKVSLLLAAFALVAGLSQCKKPNLPVINPGGTQHVVINASWDNGGAKIDQNGTLFKWTIDDILTVSGGATGNLKCTNVTEGIFEGDITKNSGEKVTFTFKSENYKEDFKEQSGELNDAVSLTGEAPYSAVGKYDVSMTMPHAVLRLDLSRFATKTGETTVTISVGESGIASVTGITSDSKTVYVAIPTDETPSEKTYKFENELKAIEKNCILKENHFYTAADAAGNPTGNSIALKSYFTVGMDNDKPRLVEFAPGNLYWDGDSFEFEANQWDCKTTWNKSHVSHFLWSKDERVGYAEKYSTANNTYGITPSADDNFFTNATETTPKTDFSVNGEAGLWRTLSFEEWNYLTDKHNYAYVTLTDVVLDNGNNTQKGIVILPDGSKGTASNITTTSDLVIYEAVFFPAAKFRNGTSIQNDGHGYWLSTPTSNERAYNMNFSSTTISLNTLNGNRAFGDAVRLVRSAY